MGNRHVLSLGSILRGVLHGTFLIAACPFTTSSMIFFFLFYFPTRASAGFSVIPIDAIDELNQELIRTW